MHSHGKNRHTEEETVPVTTIAISEVRSNELAAASMVAIAVETATKA